MMALLSVDTIGKLYGIRPVLRGVTFEVDRGEYVALLGANGAGKTTLLRILATLSKPNGGALHIDGIDALKNPDRARARIGFVSHHSLIYPDLTAIENLRFYRAMYAANRHELESRIEEVLRRVNLWNRAHDFARTFSRGMMQRLTIARAILHDPPLLLFDEPFTGLDQASAANLSTLFKEVVANDKAVVMTTHEFSRGLDGVTRALSIKNGKIDGELRDNIDAATLIRFTS
jgi:heme ABC exporter ATP-binding subunit CcmA